ncbi:probable choline kinase 1 [Tanacetum coccineum]
MDAACSVIFLPPKTLKDAGSTNGALASLYLGLTNSAGALYFADRQGRQKLIIESYIGMLFNEVERNGERRRDNILGDNGNTANEHGVLLAKDKAARGLDIPGNQPSNEEEVQFIDDIEKYRLANHLFWGLWGIISDYVITIDFDYMEYVRFRQYLLRKPQLLKGNKRELRFFITRIDNSEMLNLRKAEEENESNKQRLLELAKDDKKKLTSMPSLNLFEDHSYDSSNYIDVENFEALDYEDARHEILALGLSTNEANVSDNQDVNMFDQSATNVMTLLTLLEAHKYMPGSSSQKRKFVVLSLGTGVANKTGAYDAREMIGWGLFLLYWYGAHKHFIANQQVVDERYLNEMAAISNFDVDIMTVQEHNLGRDEA